MSKEFEIKDVEDDILQPTLVKRVDSDSSDHFDEDKIELTPVYTETFRATTENDNHTHQTLCGQSHVEPVGESEWNVTIEGLVIKEQLQQLIAMRPAEGELKVISDAKTFRGVEFDRFTFSQTDDVNTAEFEHNGETKRQSAFTFQLQTDSEN